ncbi:MAG: hypothetical protein RR246_03455, partial [Clostridia bacterium]
MKQNFIKKILSVLLAISIIMSAGIISVIAFKINEPSKPVFLSAPINKKYIDYINSGAKGTPVSPLDLSYLSKSYELQAKKSRANVILPSAYDMRDYGLVSPVKH